MGSIFRLSRHLAAQTVKLDCQIIESGGISIRLAAVQQTLSDNGQRISGQMAAKCDASGCFWVPSGAHAVSIFGLPRTNEPRRLRLRRDAERVCLRPAGPRGAELSSAPAASIRKADSWPQPFALDNAHSSTLGVAEQRRLRSSLPL